MYTEFSRKGLGYLSCRPLIGDGRYCERLVFVTPGFAMPRFPKTWRPLRGLESIRMCALSFIGVSGYVE